MLKNIPPILSPELLKVLCEMGHSDRICIGDGNFPGAAMAKAKGAIFLRADGHGVPELLDAILQVFPLDAYVEKPVTLMEKMERDKDLQIPVWETYKQIVAKYDARGAEAVGNIDRFDFYDEAKDCYCIIQTGESQIYANVILQKRLQMSTAIGYTSTREIGSGRSMRGMTAILPVSVGAHKILNIPARQGGTSRLPRKPSKNASPSAQRDCLNKK